MNERKGQAGVMAVVLEALALIFAVSAGVGCGSLNASAQSQAMNSHEASQPVGFFRFVFDPFHGLSRGAMQRSAVPWKVLAAALMAYDDARASDPRRAWTEDGFVRLLERRYGFIVPTRVANWPAGDTQPAFKRPLGIVGGTLASALPHVELEVTNLGCSTCHSGVLYDAAGDPTREAWVGLPSSSFDPGRYADEVYGALARASDHPEETLALVRRIFPGVSQTELASLRRYYFPELARRIGELRATIDGFTPYSNGGPGLTNGVATLKLYLGVIDSQRRDPTQTAFTSIPDLAPMRVRTSILWDGIYAPPGWAHTGPLDPKLTFEARRDGLGGITSIVTMGTLGVAPEVAVTNIPLVADAVGWMMTGYQPPKFPGHIDAPLAARGAAVFEASCARCHGSYEETPSGLRIARYPNKLVPADVIETDPVRADAITGDPNALFSKNAMGPHVDARATGGYIATALTSLWASAPYLHNGSVPTLWHLMHPEARPARFQVGGHRLDFQKVGIDGADGGDGVYRYPASYRPWMDPDIYDTRTPGRSNAGHVEPFDQLPEDDKRALIEYLKRT